MATQSQGNTLQVIVQSGRVAVYPQGAEEQAVILEAGQSAVVPKAGAQPKKLEAVNPNQLAWKTRTLQYRDTPLQQIITDLNRAYHSQISLANPQLQNCPVTVEFREQSLEAVLRVLESTLDLSVERTDDGIIISGEGC